MSAYQRPPVFVVTEEQEPVVGVIRVRRDPERDP
jgi:hypothetical protein